VLLVPIWPVPETGNHRSRFENWHTPHRLFKVGIDKIIATPLRRIQNRDAAFLATVLEPVLELLGDLAQTVARTEVCC
jgi:hypothetical protein